MYSGVGECCVLRDWKSWISTRFQGSISAVKAWSALTLAIAIFCGGATGAHARVGRGRGRAGGRAAVVASRAHATGNGAKVAVQPIDGTNGGQLRALVTRIVHGRGFRTMTSLPHYDGTAQYPMVARDHHLAAFVTGDGEERGKWSTITFLVWNGVNGSVIGRWTTSAPTTYLARAVGKGFWTHLGPAVLKAEAPPLPLDQEPAPPMRIDASAATDEEPVATRE
jgi:hypothetical protein